MVIPYTMEAGLSVSLEPSLLYNFTEDNKGFHIDTEFERDEPPSNPKDYWCVDKTKGPDKLAVRYLKPEVEDDVVSSASIKSTKKINRRLSRIPTRINSSTKNAIFDFKIKDITKDSS